MKGLLVILFFWVLIEAIRLFRQLWQAIKKTPRLRSKNQEGVGSLSKTRHQLFLLLALVQTACFLIDWILHDFEQKDLYLALLMVGFPLYLYFFLDCDDD